MIYLILYVLFGALDYSVRVYLVLNQPEDGLRPVEFQKKSDAEVKKMFFFTAIIWPLNWVATILCLILPMEGD